MRKIADCRRFESDSNCTITIIGEEDEVLDVASAHAVATHGHTAGPQLREEIRSVLESEESYVPGQRETQPFPG